MMVNLVIPGRLVTEMQPSCAATTASTIARPRPVLLPEALASRAREVSARVKRSNSSGSSSGGMPGPSSVMLSSTRGPGGATPRWTEAASREVPGRGGSAVRATLTVEPGEPILVNGDEHRLHQVLANLLSNAGKHTPPGSTVSVALTGDPPLPENSGEAASVQRGVLPPGPRVELSITDDGPGIPPELLPELFERFTRADTSRARDASDSGKSTGLGLAIVDAVVAAHEGCISVTSRPGMTRFGIILPLLREPAGQP
jgi:signal transduction histidine kinase